MPLGLAKKSQPIGRAKSIDGVIRQVPVRRKRHAWHVRIVIASSAVVLLVIGVIILLLFMHRSTHPNMDDVHVIESRVRKHYSLPANEDPALATVTNSAKLQSNFVAPLKNGDKILIYAGIKRAIVYRPSTDRIIDVEPVNVSSDSQASSSQSSQNSTAIPNINPFGN